MREYKFRAWDKITKQICLVISLSYEVIDKEIDSVILSECNKEIVWRNIEDIALMQYTGLKDKNEIEIYEGDIVQIADRFGYVTFLLQEMGYVIVLKNSDIRLGHRSMGGGYEINTDIKVIGNIYENPELIEEKHEI